MLPAARAVSQRSDQIQRTVDLSYGAPPKNPARHPNDDESTMPELCAEK